MKMLSLDDAIKAVTMLLDCETDTDKVWSCDVINNLQNAPSVTDVEPTQKWISVKDRLPEKSGTYLCYQPKAASICALNTVRWSEVKGWMGKEVGSKIEGIEYWMPLPNPPEE